MSHMSHPTLQLRTISDAPSMLGKHGGRQAQGELFALALLPRQLPVLKSGPEDDAIFRRLANRQAPHTTH